MIRSSLAIIVLALASLACSMGASSDAPDPAAVARSPLVLLLAPANGSVYAEGTLVEFMAIAQDSFAGAVRIEFRVDDVMVGEVTAQDAAGQPSLDGRMTWDAQGKQGHIITVEAFRADGSSLGEDNIAIRVTDRPGSLPGASPVDTPNAATPPQATPVPTPTLRVDMGILAGPVARVTSGTGLAVREGPDTTYARVGDLGFGDQTQIVGRNADSTWWAVEFGGNTGWIFAGWTTVQGDASQVPILPAP